MDPVRLAAFVLLAKAPARSAVLRLRAGEMGRWLGISESSVIHTVLPAMREAGVVETEPLVDESGRVIGLEWKFLPLLAARESGDPMHPLALARKDLATLLRFAEVLFAPGWAPVDGPVTPPGLLAGRRGRGAATDRLALLLLALQTRPNGSVRLVGGSVKEGRGRADATVAKALGCSVSGGGKVVDRLAARRLVEVVRGTTGTGQFGKSKLLVPAIAAAYRRLRADELQEVAPEAAGAPPAADPCPSCAAGAAGEGEGAAGEGLVVSGEGWLQESFDDVEPEEVRRPVPAPGDLESAADPEALAGSGEEHVETGGTADVGERPVAAPLHADHAPVVSLSGSAELDGGFSGEAASGCGDLPERAAAREDELDQDGTQQGADRGGLVGPLRGEQQQEAAGESGKAARRRPVKGSGQPTGTVVFVRPAALPSGLEAVLAPVRSVWERIVRPAARGHVAAAVRVQLGVLRGIVGPAEAEQALAERLERRLDQQMGRPVTDPVGWILGRGLVQRGWCWSQLCDEGRRMDTGGECPSCQTLIGDRRALRFRIAAETARELDGAAHSAVQAETEKRLNAEVTAQAAAQMARREQARVEKAARAEAVEQRRAELAAAEQERLAAPCADCGIPEAAGRCLVCCERRAVDRLLAEAVDLAVMARTDLADPTAVAEDSARCAADTRALLDRHLERLRADHSEDVALMFAAREIATELRDRRRESLQRALLRSPQAQAEADQAYDAKMRSAHRYPTRSMAEAAAEQDADDALNRAAQFLFTDRARQLTTARNSAQERPAAAGWRRRCADLAAQDLPEDSAAPFGVRGLEAVSAA
ncbi:hypothetical protein AB0393_28165 [Streptomyces cyaneofuscatus]|uniref:hypothetical protein n=1 Tax=Streptomyces cyaneofuscatus TaxID=66883 RepID=UPI00344F69BC